MEGLRIGVMLIVSFTLGVISRSVLGAPSSSNAEATNHLSASTTCPTCNNDCAPTFFSSR